MKTNDGNHQVPVAVDIAVYIPDLNHGVPGSNLRVWEYREKVDPNWQPDPNTYPGVQTAALPTRYGNLAAQAIDEIFKRKLRERGDMDFGYMPTQKPTVQFIGKTNSLDLREWHTREFRGVVGGQPQWKELPTEQHRPLESAASMFLQTVHHCFAGHLPLGIRPEALMWMVLHEIGIAVQKHPESYRYLFTESPDKQLIDVQVNGLDIHLFDQEGAWAEGIELLHQGLTAKMPTTVTEYMLPGFTTDDIHSRTASVVAVLSAASPFYDFCMRTCCGIPKIRLFGTGQDYDKVYANCQALSEIFGEHLGKYFKYLLPVLKEIADTATGRKAPDNGFWSSIYKHYSGSGTDDMDGWITAFINYLYEGGQYHEKPEVRYDWAKSLTDNEKKWGEGIHREDIPNHLASVDFVWNYAKDHSHQTDGEFAGRNFKLENQGNGAFFKCQLVGGFMAVENVEGYATPVLSYAVIRGEEVEVEMHENGIAVPGVEKVLEKKSVYAF